MRTAVVILHYGDPDMTAGLYACLCAADPQRTRDIFVFDNHAPRPFAGAWLRAECNLYWAGALERALSAVRGLGYTHLWFLNNDIVFETPAPLLGRAEARITRMQHSIGPVGIYAPAVTRNPYHVHMVEDPRFQYRKVAFVDGIAPLINLECWQAVGGVDYVDNPYGYGVDIWFSLQARDAGWPVVVDHGLVVRHAYHSTARKIEGFLAKAAFAERRYLSARLGDTYKQRLDVLKQQWTDEETL